MQKQTQLVNELWPLLLPRVREVVGGAAGGTAGAGALTEHDLGGGDHRGELRSDQAPQFLLRDGTRSLTGNLAVAPGVTIDGVDISESLHPRLHDILSTDDHIVYGAAGQVVGLRYENNLGFVGPGEGLYFNIDSWHINAGEGLEIDSDALRIKASIAGAGLTYTAGVVAVGAGAGLTVSADAVALTVPGTLSVVTTNNASGSHVHAVQSSADPDATASLLATTAAGLLSLRNLAMRQAAQSYATFASGFAGSGWRVDYGITSANRASAEFDDLTVRGRMRVYELLIQQIRATNGSLFVTSGSKTVTVTQGSSAWMVNGEQLYFNGAAATFNASFYTITTAAAGDTSRSLYHGFLYGDNIVAQQVEWNGSEFAGVMQSKMEVTRVDSLTQYGAVMVEGDAPATGYDYVRRGNTVDTSRRGAIYLTSDDSNAPFIDIIDGLRYHSDWGSADVKRVRLGKLSGISDVDFGGPLDGYGLYANRAYIKGTVVVTGGNAATTDALGTGLAGRVPTGGAALDVNANTTTIDGGRITANSITAAQIAANTITTTLLNFTPVLTGNVVASINATSEGLRIAGNRIEISGTTTFASGYDPTTKADASATSSALAGKIATGGAAADVNANVTTISGGKITAGSITANRLSISNLAEITGALVVGTANKLWLNEGGDGQLVIGGAVKANAPFKVSAAGALTSTSGAIGGWSIGAAALTNSNIGLYTGAIGTARLEVGTGSTAGGICSGNTISDVMLWFGSTHTGRVAAKFRVLGDGTLLTNGATIGGHINIDSGFVLGPLYAGTNAVRLSTDGERLVLPDTTGLDVPTSSSAIRWVPSIDGTHDNSKNYTGMVGYRHVTYGLLDMLSTSFVGSNETTTRHARNIMQAGHHDGTTYTDARIEVVREAGSGPRYVGVYADRLEINGAARLMALAATPAIGGSGESGVLYVIGDKFVVAYNEGGLVRYKWLTLSGTGVGWSYSATAP